MSRPARTRSEFCPAADLDAISDALLWKIVALAPFVPGRVVDAPVVLAEALELECDDGGGHAGAAGRDDWLVEIDPRGLEKPLRFVGVDEPELAALLDELAPRDVDRLGHMPAGHARISRRQLARKAARRAGVGDRRTAILDGVQHLLPAGHLIAGFGDFEIGGGDGRRIA